METEGLNALLQKMKEKEDRDNAIAKKIKESESIIKAEEENIKKYTVLKAKLTVDLEKKLIESSQQETTNEILLQKKLIWMDMLERTRKDLKKEEERMDDLLRDICSNRISFCENMKDYLQKNNYLEMSSGFVKSNVSRMAAPQKIKIENDSDEHESLTRQMESLQAQLEELTAEEAKIEEAKQYKAQLQIEPSCGESFLRLQDSLKDMKDKLENAETEIRAVKNNIAQKELLLLRRRNSAKKSEDKTTNNQDVCQQPQIKLDATSGNSQDIGQKKSGVKLVQFKNTVEVKQDLASSQLKSILKRKSFTAQSPSPSLRKKLTEKLVSKLDEEMKEILFKNKK
uniref:Shootin-1 n=1 Tax=Graphocephala atropunctata TaxID=36148 RepID=A0A1B6MN47_9HEMI